MNPSPVSPPLQASPFGDLGLRRVVNAAGKMTYLGGSALSPGVAAAMAAAGQAYVDMAELQQQAGRRIAALTGAEAAMVTSCAASGLVAAVAACLTGIDMGRVRSLPDTSGLERVEVVIQRGHAVDFGMPMLQLIRMTGARPVEVGSVNRTDPEEFRAALSWRTAAVLYVVSHHAQRDGMLALDEVIEMADGRGIPVIVDAAAEMDLRAYVAAGAAAVVYSGQKAVGAPTSGFVVGRSEIIEACRLQQYGICRPMKVGKEAIAGLLRALEEYVEGAEEQRTRALEQRARRLASALSEVVEREGGAESARVDVVPDETRPIPRVRLSLLGADAGHRARGLVRGLEGGDPSVRTRNHHVDSGVILFDVRTLKDEEIETVARRVGEELRRLGEARRAGGGAAQQPGGVPHGGGPMPQPAE